jgi:hypothetical protein
VTHTALPIIYQQYKTSDPPIRRKAVLDILTELLIASKKLYGSVEDVGYGKSIIIIRNRINLCVYRS